MDCLEKKAAILLGESIKYFPAWSLLSKVLEVCPGILVVQEWGTYGSPRQVPVAFVRLLSCSVPTTLQQLNLKLLEFEVPHAVQSRFVRTSSSLPPKSWSEVMPEAQTSSRKCPRINGQGTSSSSKDIGSSITQQTKILPCQEAIEGEI